MFKTSIGIIYKGTNEHIWKFSDLLKNNLRSFSTTSGESTANGTRDVLIELRFANDKEEFAARETLRLIKFNKPSFDIIAFKEEQVSKEIVDGVIYREASIGSFTGTNLTSMGGDPVDKNSEENVIILYIDSKQREFTDLKKARASIIGDI